MSVAIIAAASAGAASTPTPSFAQSMSSSAKSTTDDVSKWTQKQWNAAKAKWVKEKDSSARCNSQASARTLSGRNSWSFIYDCMTTS